MPKTSWRARAVAERCEDAYCFDRYKSWPGVAYALLRAGYSEREAEAIMRSKWMRWAADWAGARYGYATSTTILTFIEKHARKDCSPARLAELVAGTFPTSEVG